MKIVLPMLEYLARLRRGYKQSIVILTDALLCYLAIIVAFAFRIEVLSYWNRPVENLLSISLPLSLVTFWVMGVYRAVFRYAGIGMMRTLFRGFAIYTLLLLGFFAAFRQGEVSRSIVLLQPIIFLMLVALSRITGRYLFVDLLGRGRFRGNVRTVAIYGAGGAGQQLAGSVMSEPGTRLVAYIDDDPRLHGQRIDGIPIKSHDEVSALIDRHRLTDVLLAIPSLTRSARREIVDRLAHHPIHVRTLPQMNELLDGHVSVSDIRDLDIQDLLGREPVRANHLLLARTVVGKTVLVTGAGGSIGSELCRRILDVGARKLLLVENNEYALYAIDAELRQLAAGQKARTEIVPFLGSVTDAQRLNYICSNYRPHTLFHAAAYKHVPLVEANPIEAIRNNVFGTLETVKAAMAAGVENCILVSTDKAVRPANVMGATKRSAELIFQAAAELGVDTTFSMVRFGNVLGSSGSVVPLFRRQIAAGGPITLTAKGVTRYFMTIPEAAELVIQAAGLARGGEVFVLDMGQPVRIEDLARTMIRLSGLSVRDDQDPDGDIAIQEVGLRPGEKLFEELLIGDDPQPTLHERIFMAREASLPWADLTSALTELESCGSELQAVHLLEKLVPEFADQKRKQLTSS
ncbi:nucleoside-diphosphate sugar epimerase [Tsuneonella deserti]|uniref:Nucleoside-diphosphate sugar epimerase n=1 Tax=Tsuneonella deserti TaxID=2035528 RepID=A0ABQ1SAH8_9SPHN|nr:nucleoside-diphosphate sugar epimerase/dehydratase [Tsuneonella deserti]GGE03294.1 nucleoside-diphosphate sugar epimerase [Tsuneonella deserti]